MSTITFKILSSTDIKPFLMTLAQKRIDTFRQWPYLYDGKLKDAVEYISNFINSQRSHVILAFDDTKIIGALTGIPLADSIPEFRDTFYTNELNPSDYFYISEAMIQKPYRGKRLLFKMLKSLHKNAQNKVLCFSMIQRKDHLKSYPKTLSTLGFTQNPNCKAILDWKEVGNNLETSHELIFWFQNKNKFKSSF